MRTTLAALTLTVGVLAAGAGAASEPAQKTVVATANIFGAGGSAPAPSGGGRGTPPPMWQLPARGTRIVTFPRIVGAVTPISGAAQNNGAAGDGIGPTDVTSWGGISGIVHGRNGMFLVGVFLGPARPKRPAPPRLDFTGKERFSRLAPRAGPDVPRR